MGFPPTRRRPKQNVNEPSNNRKNIPHQKPRNTQRNNKSPKQNIRPPNNNLQHHFTNPFKKRNQSNHNNRSGHNHTQSLRNLQTHRIQHYPNLSRSKKNQANKHPSIKHG